MLLMGQLTGFIIYVKIHQKYIITQKVNLALYLKLAKNNSDWIKILDNCLQI